MLLECLECRPHLIKVQNSGTKKAQWNVSRRRSGGVGGLQGGQSIHWQGSSHSSLRLRSF